MKTFLTSRQFVVLALLQTCRIEYLGLFSRLGSLERNAFALVPPPRQESATIRRTMRPAKFASIAVLSLAVSLAMGVSIFSKEV